MYGVPSPFKGKRHKSETIQRFKVPVEVWKITGEYVGKWESMGEASKALNCNYGKICDVCRGNRKQHKGMLFKYVGQDQKHNLDSTKRNYEERRAGK